MAGRQRTVVEAGPMNPAFWKDRRVLVTGHTGFKGAWLSLWLRELGSRVSGYALPPPTDPSLFALAEAHTGMDDVRGDVRDPASLESAVRVAAPEIVFHLAAQSLVRESYRSPVETYATNIMGTVHLLDAIRRTPGVRAVVVVTSDKCYENRESDRAYREDDAFGGHDPYSSSKACAELVTAAYRRSFFNGIREMSPAIASARAGNVIGGGDWATDRLVPDLLRAFAEGRPAAIRNPEATRPWQHVLEPLRGYLALAERLAKGDASAARGWNFGPLPPGARSVGAVADIAARAWGEGAKWESDTAVHPHEARSLELDIADAGRILGWHPLLSVEMAIEWTVRWHKGLQAGHRARALTFRDIAEYMALITAGARQA
jgi:CDP-glucose 4,6-dehydratase